MKILIRGGLVVDPVQALNEPRDVLIEDGRILDLVLPGGGENYASGAEVIEAAGLIVTPGLIDMHVHLREPGHEYKETIASGCAAAAAGGFTAVAAMPNTSPVNDNRSVTEFILSQARLAGTARVYPVAAMTMGQKGEELCEYGELAEAGAAALSDDGRPVVNSRVMRFVLEYSKAFNLTVISHAEDVHLSEGGSMNEGVWSMRLGLSGIPAASESTAVYRDIQLAALTGVPVHIAHVSTAESVAVIRRAKADGLPVTAETAPHYFTLTEAEVAGYRTNAKMNPPLRTQADLEAVRQGLADGALDAVATDHAPHSSLEKEVEFDQAAFGIIGLETSLPLTLNLVREKVLTLSQAVALLSANPAKILKVPGGNLVRGETADLTLIDPGYKWVVKAGQFKSLSRNTPFEGWNMTGRAVLTMVGGRIINNRPD